MPHIAGNYSGDRQGVTLQVGNLQLSFRPCDEAELLLDRPIAWHRQIPRAQPKPFATPCSNLLCAHPTRPILVTRERENLHIARSLRKHAWPSLVRQSRRKPGQGNTPPPYR